MNKRERIRHPDSVQDARRLIQAGADMEVILLFFRDRGFDIADCIYSVEELYGKEFSVAKGLVFNSRAWGHQYESATQLREAARAALKQLKASNSPDLPRIIFEDGGE
jgi:hypothetical protein